MDRGRVAHEAWRRAALKMGAADHPECNSIICDYTTDQHHPDMVPWEQLSPDRRRYYADRVTIGRMRRAGIKV